MLRLLMTEQLGDMCSKLDFKKLKAAASPRLLFVKYRTQRFLHLGYSQQSPVNVTSNKVVHRNSCGETSPNYDRPRNHR